MSQTQHGLSTREPGKYRADTNESVMDTKFRSRSSRRWINRLVYVCLASLLPPSVFAEDGDLVDKLKEEPASLFDLGMLRLEHLNTVWESQISYYYSRSSELKNAKGNINEYFDAQDKSILVSFSLRDVVSDTQQVKAGCQAALGHMSVYLVKSLHVLFSHAGQVSSPEEISALRDLFRLECTVYGNSTEIVRFRGKLHLNGEGEIDVVNPH